MCRASARRTTSVLRASVASSIPVPRPVATAGSAPVKAQISAAAGVVFAMPMSPVTRQRCPAPTSSPATSMPTSTARRASSRLIAGPAVMSAVPAATRRCRRSGCASSGVRTPTSTTVTLAPTCRAKALTTAPPARKFATICAVTSCGHGVTPWACTPWSPANTATAAGWGSGGGHDPAMPASATARSSTRPSAPRGLVMRSSRSRAAARASALTGRMAATVSATRSGIRRADHAAAALVNATSVSPRRFDTRP